MKTVLKCADDIANGMAYEGSKLKDCFTDPGWIKGYVVAFWDTLENTFPNIRYITWENRSYFLAAMF